MSQRAVQTRSHGFWASAPAPNAAVIFAHSTRAARSLAISMKKSTPTAKPTCMRAAAIAAGVSPRSSICRQILRARGQGEGQLLDGRRAGLVPGRRVDGDEPARESRLVRLAHPQGHVAVTVRQRKGKRSAGRQAGRSDPPRPRAHPAPRPFAPGPLPPQEPEAENNRHPPDPRRPSARRRRPPIACHAGRAAAPERSRPSRQERPRAGKAAARRCPRPCGSPTSSPGARPRARVPRRNASLRKSLGRSQGRLDGLLRKLSSGLAGSESLSPAIQSLPSRRHFG